VRKSTADRNDGGGGGGGIFAFRRPVPHWAAVLLGLLCIAVVIGIWWFLTRGEPEERILPPSKGLSSPAETFAQFRSLWFDRELDHWLGNKDVLKGNV
jgi:hypothetical protein